MIHYDSIEGAPELPSKGDGYTFDAKGHRFHARWVEPGRWSVVIGHGDEFMAHVTESNETYIVNQIVTALSEFPRCCSSEFLRSRGNASAVSCRS